MSKNYRVWKWNVLANIRPVFFFLVQVYLCVAWLQVRSLTKHDRKKGTFIAFDSNPLSNLAFILCIVHAIIAVVAFIPHGLVSLVAQFDSPSSKRLCEWSNVSSAFLSLVILVAEKKAIFQNASDSALIFYSSIFVNIAAFNHIGIPDLFLVITAIVMIPLWLVFLSWTIEDESSGASSCAATVALVMIGVCTWLQQRDYRRSFEGQQSSSKINDDFLMTVNLALKYGDEKLRVQGSEIACITTPPPVDQRTMAGNLISIRYWYLAISAALSPKEETTEERYTSLTFVQMSTEVFADYERAIGKSASLYFDTTNIDLKIIARVNLFQTLIYGLLEYKGYKDHNIHRICRLSCVDDDGKDWKLIFEIICNLKDAELAKKDSTQKRAAVGKYQSANHHAPKSLMSNIGALESHVQSVAKNDISLKYPMSLEKEPVAKSDFESTTAGSILTAIAEKMWQHKFEHSTDEMEEFYIERIEISLPNDMCSIQSDINSTVANAVTNSAHQTGTGDAAPSRNGIKSTVVATISPDSVKGTDIGITGSINTGSAPSHPQSLSQMNIVSPPSKFQPWIIISQRFPETGTRMEIRTKLNKLLVPTQLIPLSNMRSSHRFGIVVISEQLLSKIAHAAQDESADYPDLISLEDLRSIVRYLIVITDNDIELSELEQQYRIEADRTIYGKATLADLFDTVMMVSHDLRQHVDGTTPKYEQQFTGRQSLAPQAPNDSRLSPPRGAEDATLIKPSTSLPYMETTEFLLKSLVKIRRSLQKHNSPETDPHDTILHDRLKTIRANSWDLLPSGILLPAQDSVSTTTGGRKSILSKSSSVLDYIEDSRRRKQSEIALEFMPKFSIINEILQQKMNDIEWQDLSTKLHDVDSLASTKDVPKLRAWLLTLVEVVDILRNKRQEHAIKSTAAAAAANSSANAAATAANVRLLEDVVEDIEESTECSSNSSNSSSAKTNHMNSSSNPNPSHPLQHSGEEKEDEEEEDEEEESKQEFEEESFVDEQVMQSTKEIFASAQMVLFRYITG